jgi:hypothetical protein
MEAMCSSETSFVFRRTTSRYIQEDGTILNIFNINVERATLGRNFDVNIWWGLRVKHAVQRGIRVSIQNLF